MKDAALVAREILRLARAELAEILRRLAAETHTQWHAIYVAPRRSERGGRGGAHNTRGRCTCFCDQTQKRRIDIAPHRDASARRLTKRRYLHIATTSPCHGHTARTYWRSFANRMPAQTRDLRRSQTQKSVRVQSQQGGHLRHDVVEELKDDAAGRLAVDGAIKEDLRVARRCRGGKGARPRWRESRMRWSPSGWRQRAPARRRDGNTGEGRAREYLPRRETQRRGGGSPTRGSVVPSARARTEEHT